MAKKLEEKKFDVQEAAEKLGIRPKTLYGIVEAGKIAHFRIGGNGKGKIVFSESHLQNYLQKNEVAAA